MYICLDCGHVFDDPHLVVYHSPECGRLFGMLCPKCEDGYYVNAEQCPDCGRWMPKGDKLCEICREELRDRFRTFRETLTAAQEDELDKMLDGESIKDV